MKIDFSSVDNKEITIVEFANQFSVDDLRAATETSVETVWRFVEDMTEEQLMFIPNDPNANDLAAIEGEERIGWSLAHLVLHVTASCEEGAAFSSVLARGIPIGGRLRSEPYWKTVTTKKQVLHRLEESRRMRLAFLDTWPDEPHLDVFREVPESSPNHNKINAKVSFIFGLKHESGHYEQFREVRRQAMEAITIVG